MSPYSLLASPPKNWRRDTLQSYSFLSSCKINFKLMLWWVFSIHSQQRPSNGGIAFNWLSTSLSLICFHKRNSCLMLQCSLFAWSVTLLVRWFVVPMIHACSIRLSYFRKHGTIVSILDLYLLDLSQHIARSTFVVLHQLSPPLRYWYLPFCLFMPRCAKWGIR